MASMEKESTPNEAVSTGHTGEIHFFFQKPKSHANTFPQDRSNSTIKIIHHRKPPMTPILKLLSKAQGLPREKMILNSWYKGFFYGISIRHPST